MSMVEDSFVGTAFGSLPGPVGRARARIAEVLNASTDRDRDDRGIETEGLRLP